MSFLIYGESSIRSRILNKFEREEFYGLYIGG